MMLITDAVVIFRTKFLQSCGAFFLIAVSVLFNLLSISMLLLGYVALQDEYHLIDYERNIESEVVAVAITNFGGGGPGYCLDLIYVFPKPNQRSELPSFRQQLANRKYLIEHLDCGEVKRIFWEGNRVKYQ